MVDLLHRGTHSINAHDERVARNRSLFATWLPTTPAGQPETQDQAA